MLAEKPEKRLAIVGLCVGALVLLGIVFHAFIQQNLVNPFGMVLWLGWRVVLALDQRIYWVLLIVCGFIYLIIAMTRQPGQLEEVQFSSANAALESLSAWRNSILLTRDEMDRLNSLKRDLGLLLTSVYATGQPDRSRYLIYEGLKSGEIALPESIHSFLFPVETPRPRSLLLRAVRAGSTAPGRWYRRLRGQDMLDYCRSIEEVLARLEELLEKNHE